MLIPKLATGGCELSPIVVDVNVRRRKLKYTYCVDNNGSFGQSRLVLALELVQIGVIARSGGIIIQGSDR